LRISEGCLREDTGWRREKNQTGGEKQRKSLRKTNGDLGGVIDILGATEKISKKAANIGKWELERGQLMARGKTPKSTRGDSNH